MLPFDSGCPWRTTATKRSRNRPCVRISGPIVRPVTPGSRSTVPSRSAVLSLSGFGMKRRRIPGACAAARAMSAGPKFSTKPSLLRMVKVRARVVRSSINAGRSTDSAASTTWRTRSRNSSARGVGTRPRPARTRSGSPVASRRRASDRRMADGRSWRRSAARATLPSDSRTSRVTSRLRSGVAMGEEVPRMGHDMAFHARMDCEPCVFRPARCRPNVPHYLAAGAPMPLASSTDATPERPTASAVRGALLAMSLTMLLSSLGTSIANVALPTFVHALDASFQAVQWIVLAYLLAVTTFVVSVGRLGDLWGRRRLMLAGIGLFTVASAACAGATGLWMLIAARVVQGLGAAIMMALTMALVGEAVPKSRAGSAMGLLGTMSAVGTALGPSLGGVLIAASGWPAIFLINLPLGCVALILAYRAG